MSEVITSELNDTIHKPDKTLNITFRVEYKPGRKRVRDFFNQIKLPSRFKNNR